MGHGMMMMPGYGMMMPGYGMMQGGGMGQGMGMMQGRGMDMMQGRGKHGRHRGRRGAGPTLRIKTEGKGFEIDFECRAPLEDCLGAIERVYEIAGERRTPGRRAGRERAE